MQKYSSTAFRLGKDAPDGMGSNTQQPQGLAGLAQGLVCGLMGLRPVGTALGRKQGLIMSW